MTGPQTATGARVVLGVGGGIAAYKVCELLRLLTESGRDVTVVPTANALRFVGTATWEALSGHPVSDSVFDGVEEVRHVRLGQDADLVVVAPATADLLARAAAGCADDLLTATLLTVRCPVLFVPAMHTEMWLHPATQANVRTLRERGSEVMEPAVGRLTGADSGPGRLPDPADIFARSTALLQPDLTRGDLAGRRVVVTAGGTREYLDPVRFLGNRSSGKQGYALAESAAARGAEVVLVAANVMLDDPVGVKVLRVESTDELADVTRRESAGADAVVMAAAPADFRPARRSDAKIKKRAGVAPEPIELVENTDILAGLVRDRADGGASRPVLVGFAAETGGADAPAIVLAREKLGRKGCDLLVLNEVSGGAVFGADETAAVLLAPGADEVTLPSGSKRALADAIWDRVSDLLA